MGTACGKNRKKAYIKRRDMRKTTVSISNILTVYDFDKKVLGNSKLHSFCSLFQTRSWTFRHCALSNAKRHQRAHLRSKNNREKQNERRP